jgi:hypothetical protein
MGDTVFRNQINIPHADEMVSVLSEKFARKPFYPVASDRVTHFSGNRDSKAGSAGPAVTEGGDE